MKGLKHQSDARNVECGDGYGGEGPRWDERRERGLVVGEEVRRCCQGAVRVTWRHVLPWPEGRAW